MRYSLQTPLAKVKGVGPTWQRHLDALGWQTVQDLVLAMPLRYEDRSVWSTCDELPGLAANDDKQLFTLKVKVEKVSQRRQGRRSMQSAQLRDESGTLTARWFNCPWVMTTLVVGEWYVVSGRYQAQYRSLTQPKVERLQSEMLHTGRLVPVYGLQSRLKLGSFRRLLKHVLDNLEIEHDWRQALPVSLQDQILPLSAALPQLHFPEQAEMVIKARERLAVEELLQLIQHSQTIKKHWEATKTAVALAQTATMPSWPFELTAAQQTAINEVLNDCAKSYPMNRLLVGDVGSGKTVVAATAAYQFWKAGFSSCIVAPTQILAEQHAQTLATLLPELPVQLWTASSRGELKLGSARVFVGTHALLSKLEDINPALIVYDEQHRFGVRQRTDMSQFVSLPHHPHVLTMSATPIPRSLMLTIFAHLALSVIDQMPAGRLVTTTWVVPAAKRQRSWRWLAEQLLAAKAAGRPAQALVVCPFIEPSNTPGFEAVPAATSTYQELQTWLEEQNLALQVGLLHGKQPLKTKTTITKQLFNQTIDLLVTTPVIEVGLDLPAASFIVIEGAERFGLASLHQLRGRVGRAGQQGYCLLFSGSTQTSTRQRLEVFSKTTNGLELAEQDLQHRGAGDLFGSQQHGFDQLRFAEWTNVQLISLAQQINQHLSSQHQTLQSDTIQSCVSFAPN